VNSADARRLVQDLELSETIDKIVADAPPLSDTQRDTLRHIFRPNVKDAEPYRTRRPSRTSGKSSDASGF
jgi:hypothetical protein